MMKLPRIPLTLLAAGLIVSGCEPDTTAPGAPALQPRLSSLTESASYLILGRGNKLPDNLASLVSQAGGTLTASVSSIGVATASSGSAGFAARAAGIAGIESVAQDRIVQWVDPNQRVIESEETGEAVQAQVVGGSDETFFNVQWAPQAIHAPEAWAAGFEGAGARVAILDGGIRDTHIDLRDNLDVAHSASFVPGFAFNTDVGTFWHGTHVAGILGAADNGVGTIGIAPRATLIGVKVLHNGSGSFGALIQGLVYAATPTSQGGAGADIINMSLGASFDRQGRDNAKLAVALSRATTYAYQQGVTVLASAGNDATDIDHTNNLIFVPAQSAHVIAVSATGPVGFGVGFPNGATNFSRPASYTNFGQSAIGFAAPGGDFVLPGNAICGLPRIGGGPNIVQLCWVMDLVFAPCRGSGASNGSYCWAAGTSMSSPAAAGVAALIIGKHGSPMPPAQVEAALRQSADDLGKPGNDDFYGGGFVNAFRAVQ